MVEWSVSQAARAMNGHVFGDGTTRWSGASIDSRTLQPGELFFAIPGENTDGHQFIAQALMAGAAATVVSQVDEESTLASSVILVDDPYRGLHRLTRAVRQETPRSLVAVTGSAGKTTTKELLAAILSKRYRTAKNPGNLNNLLGFPLALLGIPESTEWMVAEMGMSTPGELGQISRLGRPDIAIFLNVKPAHLEGLGGLDEVMNAKAELLEGLDPKGIVIANHHDSRVRQIAQRHGGEVVWFGEGTDFTARVVDQDFTGSRVQLKLGAHETEFRWSLVGEHQVENLLAAATCARRLGLSAFEIASTAESFQAMPGRGTVHRIGQVTVIDETYNSNPEALARVLDTAGRLAAPVRWAVLGSMLELGEQSEAFHREAGRQAAQHFHRIIAVGTEAKALARSAQELGATVQWVESADEASEILNRELDSEDLVLIKGSRGVGLDRVIQALTRGQH